jgi:hypothetical protein
MKSGTTTVAESLLYLVVVDAEYDSEWYLTPKRFLTHFDATRYAAGIAKAWHGRSDAPTISIKGPDRTDTYSIGGLHFLGLVYRWFEDLSTS